jgi:hypothetical protein
MNLRTLFLCILILPSAAAAQSSSRGDRWEFYLSPVWTAGKDYSFDGGSTAKTDTGYGWTLGFAKNLNPQLALGLEFGWGTSEYRATVTPGVGNGNARVNINGDLETWTTRFFGTYYLSSGRLAPFVSGGLGWTYIDTNIPSGPPEGFCWYYPWYGQYCATYVPTETTTKFSYNAALGLRYDFSPGFIRGLVNAQYVDFGGGYGSTYWTQYRLDFGVKF